MAKKKKVSKKDYEVGKAMGDLVKSSPYLNKKQKDKQIGEIFERM